MDVSVKDGPEDDLTSPSNIEASSTTSRRQSHKTPSESSTPQPPSKSRSRRSDAAVDASKRRCVSTACIACRRRKSKCDGNLPGCAACASVYNTECIYDPNSDHRRKGVYKKNEENLKTKNSTLHTLIQAVLNYPEDDVPALIRQIRTCESLDKVAEVVAAKERGEDVDLEEDIVELERGESNSPTFEAQLSRKMGTLKLNDGRIHFVGGTSNLIFGTLDGESSGIEDDEDFRRSNPITSWTTVTDDPNLITHVLNHYFTWHYTFFTILPKASFYKQFLQGQPPAGTRRKTEYCSPLLVNTLLSLGCHFTSSPGTREVPSDASTAGDHFFKEAKRLLYEGDELAKPSLATVQALALMSVREAGCAREANGWVYSGMAFRMSCDLGLSFQTPSGLVFNRTEGYSEEEEDARRVTFWGCFQIDKCWSNYLGRMPQFQLSDNVTVPRYIVVPIEDADTWSPYSDSGFSQAHAQPGRVRAVALQISALCEISSDIIKNFYNPQSLDKPVGKQTELKQLSEIHTRLEDWRRNLAKELEPKEGALPSTLVMHMFFQLLYIHLFRPFLKYTQATSPLPSHVSPRKLCTQAAGMISKLMRLYKRSHGLRQIVNFAIYVVHSACTIHLLNLPEKTARRDIIHGVKHLEEMAEGWLVARRTLSVLSMQAKKWKVELPDEAAAVLVKTDAKFGTVPSADTPVSPPQVVPSPLSSTASTSVPPQALPTPQSQMDWQQQQQSGPAVGDSMQIYGADNVATATSLGNIAQNDFSFPAAISTPWTQQLQMQPTTTLPSVQQDYSPRSQGPRPTRRATLKRTSTGHAIDPLQQQQGAAAQAMLQTPLMVQTPLMQPPTSTPQHTQTQRAMAQPRRPTVPRSLTQGSAPAFSSDMFGGVEALLREGQEWWMKDQSHDLASGFGNWHNSIDFGSAGFGVAQQPQQQQQQQSRGQSSVQQQGRRPSTGISQSQQNYAQRFPQQQQQQQQQIQPRPQQQYQQSQSQSPQQYQQPYQQQSFQQQPGQQAYRTLRSGSVPELFSTPSFPVGQQMQMQQLPSGSGSGSALGGAGGTGAGVGGDAGMYGAGVGQQTYDFGGLGTVYDEEEWYQ